MGARQRVTDLLRQLVAGPSDTVDAASLVDGKAEAIAYTGDLSTGLVRFLENPKMPLDANRVERALRGVAVGRKNHYGSRSERRTRAAAPLYSLIESAELAGVEPRAHPGEAARQANRNPGTVTLARDFK